jgi:transposase
VDVLVERCAGIDIGKDEVVACVRTPAAEGRGRRKQTRTFASFASSVEAMADWLAAEGVYAIAMEATGPYWKPICYVLEDRAGQGQEWELMLVNAHHVKILPGRKTDVLDAEWLAELLEHGLLRGSFVPPPVIRQLRDLTRNHKRLIQDHTSECQRIQKTLEDAGIKLDSVASDVLGVSGGAMLAALVAGQRDPERARRAGQGQAPQEDPRAAPSLTRPVHRPPRGPDRAVAGAHQLSRGRDHPARRPRRHPVRHPHRARPGRRARAPFRSAP